MDRYTSPHPARLAALIIDLLLVSLIAIGVIFRFDWVNWSQDANLHPDEYGLTGTLTVLHMPDTLGEYFNTRLSPLSPYRKYDLEGQPLQDGPDNGLRWGQFPLTLIRWTAELTGNTGYGELRLMGRRLSALVDTLALALLYLTGRRLYNHRTGLVAAALSSLAVMQIQQSHFMTVDNFAVLFTALALYAAVRAAQSPPVWRGPAFASMPPNAPSAPGYRLNLRSLAWYAVFGAAFGMVMASRINLLPLAGLIGVAAVIGVVDLRLRARRDVGQILLSAVICLAAAGLVALITFRVCQPMTFRAVTGDTYPWTININPDWLHNMQVASQESRGIGGGPPQEQWAHRTPILFPLVNMVMWGMGLPLGLAAWGGALWAIINSRRGRTWRAHAIPLVWVWGYFLFMGTRWVMSIRYFLPIYPFLCLLAAWALLELWSGPLRRARGAAGALIILVLLGTLVWANAFVSAVYRQDNTRVEASRWMIRTIPGPVQVRIQSQNNLTGAPVVIGEPVPAPDGLLISNSTPLIQSFTAPTRGELTEVVLPHAGLVTPGGAACRLRVVVAADPEGTQILDETELLVDRPSPGGEYRAGFQGAEVVQEKEYYLHIIPLDEGPVQLFHPVVSNENWDEGLPVLDFGYNIYGNLYRGITMEVRWYDDENKRQMFLNNLAQVDYIVLPSQRAIWSASRMPVTFPMTMEYYRALFDGRLGFELAAGFHHPFQIGPLSISDLGGTFAWGEKAPLPLFNYNPLAAEEAFSVYDHAPVWIFKKRADFDLRQASQVVESIDLSKVVVEHPHDSTWVPLAE